MSKQISLPNLKNLNKQIFFTVLWYLFTYSFNVLNDIYSLQSALIALHVDLFYYFVYLLE